MNKLKRAVRLAGIYRAYLGGKEKPGYPPLRLWVEATNSCNLKCVMCPQNDAPEMKRGLMSWELFRKLIDEAGDFVYDMNLHHRGESLLHPRLPEMIEYAHRRGIYTRLHTNATLLNGEKSYAILNSGLDFISFSFDGFTPESYEGIRKGAVFAETMAGIRDFLSLKKKMGRRSPFTVFETMDLLPSGERNKRGEKEEIARTLYSLQLDRFVVKLPHNWAGSYQTGRNKVSGEKELFTPCSFPWYAMVILWDGLVTPCPQDFYGRLLMGDCQKNSLRSIWNNDRYRDLRGQMARKRLTGFKICQNCDMIRRRTILNIPRPNLKNFFKEVFFGHR